MIYNIQFEDKDALTIQDEKRPAPISPGDNLMLETKLYEVATVIHNLDDGKAWVIVK